MGDVRVPTLNRIIITGRLAADPDLRYTPSGTAVCKLRIVNTKYARDNNGERQEEPCFFDATIWERQAEYCGDKLQKGRPVLVEGRLKQESWEDKQSGQPRSKLVIAASNIAPLDWDDDQGRAGNTHERAQDNRQPPEYANDVNQRHPHQCA